MIEAEPVVSIEADSNDTAPLSDCYNYSETERHRDRERAR